MYLSTSSIASWSLCTVKCGAYFDRLVTYYPLTKLLRKSSYFEVEGSKKCNTNSEENVMSVKKELLKGKLYSNVKFMLLAQSSSKFVMAGSFHMGQLCQLKRDGDMKLVEGYTHCQGRLI